MPTKSAERRAPEEPESLNARPANAGKVHAPFGPLAFFQDLDPPLSDFHADVIAGLSAARKTLSPKYLYDARGSALFDDITNLESYYPTRTEQKIVADNADAIAEAIGPKRAVFEYGSGSSEKIGRLLRLMRAPLAYVAMDISREHLLDSAAAVAEDPSAEMDLPVGAICADFTQSLALPSDGLPPIENWLGYFPGSTLGNFSPDGAAAFLNRASDTLGDDAEFFFGLDLEKDEAVLRRAYDDPEGVTAAFNLNLLVRIRDELGAEVSIDDFEHRVEIGRDPMRVEMHLRANRATTITVDGRAFDFAEGETLHTENSHKYSLATLDSLLAKTPWRRAETWTDERDWFATCLLRNS